MDSLTLRPIPAPAPAPPLVASLPVAAPVAPPVAPPVAAQAAERSGAWTIPMLCAGIAVLACCLLIPAADENRRLVWEREKLKADLEQLEKQIDVNAQFLKSVADDPTLLERLAQRQMKMVREGTSVLDLKERGGPADMSPYLLLSVPPPPEMLPYKPIGGAFSQMCRHPRTRLFLIGGALLSIACGLILGDPPRRQRQETVPGDDDEDDDGNAAAEFRIQNSECRS